MRETAVPGEATVAFTLPEGSLCIQWNLPTGMFRALKEEANADGAFILRRADGGFEAHVVECKRTVNQRKWSEVRKQMRWTLARLRGIAGVLGIELRRGVLYTAFRKDDLSPDSTRNPIALRRPVVLRAAEDAGIDWARRVEREWVEDELTLAGFDGHFEHHKIELDERGAGSICFACD